MPRVPAVAVALWASATALATAAAWAGVAAVTTEVTGEHSVALPPAQVAALDVPATTTTTSTTVPTTTTTTAPRPATTTTTAPPAVAVAAVPTTTTTTTAPATTATYAADGGVIAVACRGADIELTSARPNDGYLMEVRASGPVEVRVAFHGEADRSVLGATCQDGAPAALEPRAPDGHRRRRFSGAGPTPVDGAPART